MKICMFTNTYLPHVGGVAKSVHTFTRNLREFGHEVLIVAPQFPNTDPQKDYNVYRLPAIQNFNGSDFSVHIPVPSHLKERLNSFEPDIMHTHHPFLLGDTALRASRQHHVPLIFTHHTRYEEYTHYVPFDSKILKRFVINLSTQYANMCNRVIAPSKSIARLISERGVNTPISEIPTGIDPNFFDHGDGKEKRKRLNIPENAFVLGHLGRLAPEKNLAFLAEAAAEFAAEHENACFLVAGNGPEKQKIENIFLQKGISSRLILAGTQTGEDLFNIYRAMDVFIFSSFSETQGLVIAEAMAASLPVIALDAPGVREVVEDGKNGRLLPGESKKPDFVQAIQELYLSPEKTKSMREKARQTAAELTHDKCSRKLEELYAEAIRNHGYEQKKPDLKTWEGLQKSLDAEWDLLTQKTSAILNAVYPESSKTNSRLDVNEKNS
jgi:glycosyltransferase involved in cell wall biosynthesis